MAWGGGIGPNGRRGRQGGGDEQCHGEKEDNDELGGSHDGWFLLHSCMARIWCGDECCATCMARYLYDAWLEIVCLDGFVLVKLVRIFQM